MVRILTETQFDGVQRLWTTLSEMGCFHHTLPLRLRICLCGKEDGGKTLRTRGGQFLQENGLPHPIGLMITETGSMYEVCIGSGQMGSQHWPGSCLQFLLAEENSVFSNGVLLGVSTSLLCSDCAMSNPCPQILIKHCIIGLARALDKSACHICLWP